jgi:adenylyltransferase/sulfurtransferase
MRITPDEAERYSRMLALHDFKEADMESVMGTRVAVVGAGGLGSPALRLLTAIGFGVIRIVDRDVVELSNIQRQESNANDILKGCDIIVDGLDSFHSRRAVNKASQSLGIPYVFAGAIEYYANLTTFVPGETGCFSCIMGNVEDNPENSCERIGVTPTLLSIAAAIEVREAVLLATKKEARLKNRLMTIDISSLSFDFFEIARAENCPICSVNRVDSTVVQDGPIVTALCSGTFNVSPMKILNLDLKSIENLLARKHKVVRQEKFLLIETSGAVKVTLSTTGTATIRGVETPEKALSIYLDILQ